MRVSKTGLPWMDRQQSAYSHIPTSGIWPSNVEKGEMIGAMNKSRGIHESRGIRGNQANRTPAGLRRLAYGLAGVAISSSVPAADLLPPPGAVSAWRALPQTDRLTTLASFERERAQLASTGEAAPWLLARADDSAAPLPAAASETQEGAQKSAPGQAGAQPKLSQAAPVPPASGTPPAAPAEPAPSTLPPVNVTAEGETVKDYVATRSTTATKGDIPLIETPQSISVITREEMDARAVTTVSEALRFTPGVISEGYGYDSRGFDWFFMRGFDALLTSDYRDGLRQFNNGNFGFFRTESQGLERVEVVRGPASVTYGQGDAGGIINRVSKLPTAQPVREIMFQYGNFDFKRVSVDYGGALMDGNLLYRIVGTGLDTDTQDKYPGQKRVENSRLYIAPSLTWLSGNTSYTVMGEVLGNRTDGASFAYTEPGNRLSRLLVGEPRFNKFNQDQWSVGHKFEHRFNADWMLRQNLRHAATRADNFRVQDYGAFDPADPLNPFPSNPVYLLREANIFHESVRQTAIDTQLHGKFNFGLTDHTVMLGVDWLRARTGSRVLGDAALSSLYGIPVGVPVWDLEIANPQYGQQMVDRPMDTLADTNQKLDQVGVYLQDHVKIAERLILTLSGRHDWVMLDTTEQVSGVSERKNNSAFTGRGGLTYLLGWGLAPYFSYSQSFLPQGGVGADGRAFDPSRGEQFEFGLKYQPEGIRGLFTLAFFDLTKRNVLTVDPGNNNFRRQTGEMRSRGVELEGKLSLAQGLDLIGSYTYTDIKVTKSEDVDLGKRPIIVPKHMASGWLTYAIPVEFLRGLGLGVGVRYVGPRYRDMENTQLDRSYFLTDASIYYQRGPWRVSINGHNLFDKEYVANCTFGCFRGMERMVLGSLRYRW